MVNDNEHFNFDFSLLPLFNYIKTLCQVNSIKLFKMRLNFFLNAQEQMNKQTKTKFTGYVRMTQISTDETRKPFEYYQIDFNDQNDFDRRYLN